MGCVIGYTNPNEDKIKNPENNQSIKKSSKYVVKILLLGSGECGKTTLAKQMRIIHGNGFQETERSTFSSIVQKNLLDLVKNVLNGMKKLNIEMSDVSIKAAGETFLKLMYLEEPIQSCVELIKNISSDKGFIDAVSRGYEFQLNDTHIKFLECIERISDFNYTPTDDDIVRSRLKTTGIFEFVFPYKNFSIKLIDVGGQRSQRKKWINCFEDANAMIYVASLIDYCLTLEEDPLTSRLTESIKLFSGMCNSPYFESIPIILFLNKVDLFKDKIIKCPIKGFYPVIEGYDFDTSLNFIKNMYLKAVKTARPIYVHVTNATDTSNIKFIFDAVGDIILNKGLDETGYGT